MQVHRGLTHINLLIIKGFMANSRPVCCEINETGCWLVISHKLNKDGYFRKMTKSGKAYMYHRIIYTDYYGPIPEGFEVDHMCRNRSCINPDHLQLLTNNDHRAKTNTERTAERQEKAKAYWEATGCTGAFLAEVFDVSFSTACKWIRKWKYHP